MTALGFIQFLNPTSNWYCLFLVILIACSLHWISNKGASRLLIVGFLMGTMLLFRQLSGVLVSIGVFAYLLSEPRGEVDNRRQIDTVIARCLVVIMATGLVWYLAGATDATGFVLFGFCPVVILVWLFAKTTAGNRQVLRIITWLGIGVVIAALPLVLYHLLHGSLRPWLSDAVIGAMGLTKLNFMDQKLYAVLLLAGFRQMFHTHNIGELLNGLYWVVLPLLGLLNGIVVLRVLIRVPKHGQANYALAILGVFYAIVSVHFQIPIYLYYTVSLSLVGLLWMIPIRSHMCYAMIPLTVLLAGTGVYYHAAQPLSRKLTDSLDGHRTVFSLTDNQRLLPRSSLRVEADDHQRYAEILRMIESQSSPEETIFAFPSNAEFYFLSGRRNPFRFYNSALGIRTEAQLQQVREFIVNHPPKLVVFRPDDKYNTMFSREIISLIRERYEFLGNIGGFEIYRPAKL